MISALSALLGLCACGPEEVLQAGEELKLERGSVRVPDEGSAARPPCSFAGVQGQLEGIPWHEHAPSVTGWACLQRHAAPLRIQLFVEAGELVRPLERTAGGEPSRERVLLAEGTTEGAAGPTLGSVCGVSSEAKVRFRLAVSGYDWLAHAGRRVVAVALTARGEFELPSHRPLRLPPLPEVIGRAELVASGAGAGAGARALRIEGWACQPHVPRPVELRVSFDGDGREPLLAAQPSVVRRLQAEERCGHGAPVATGFSLELPRELVDAHAGARVVVHAVRPIGGQLDGPLAILGPLPSAAVP